jgi:membrane-bound ClpP family serine protease
MIRALCAFVVFILFMAIRPAPAATIEAKGHIIEIKGDIDHGDFDKFSAKLGAAPDAKIVSIASPGGRAQPAYRMHRVASRLSSPCRTRRSRRAPGASVWPWARVREFDRGSRRVAYR